MAKHKDIINAHAKLQGEGWHIEYHKEAINCIDTNKKYKKDKRKCIYYDRTNKNCWKLDCICIGSSDCKIYND